MLDPRIYRNGMMIAAFALIVLAFSFGSQASPLSATLVPDSFNGPGAYATMSSLAARYPERKPGSEGDNQVADYVAGAFSSDGLLVRRAAFTARTASRTVAILGPTSVRPLTPNTCR